MQEASLQNRARRRLRPVFAAIRPSSSSEAEATTVAAARQTRTISDRAWDWLARRDPFFWAMVAVALVALALRLYGINWDANNHLHPDEREIVFKSMCLSFPGTPRIGNCDPAYTGPGWLLSPSSPLNPHFFAYGSFPLYLLAAVAHGLAWITHLTGGRFLAAGWRYLGRFQSLYACRSGNFGDLRCWHRSVGGPDYPSAGGPLGSAACCGVCRDNPLRGAGRALLRCRYADDVLRDVDTLRVHSARAGSGRTCPHEIASRRASGGHGGWAC